MAATRSHVLTNVSVHTEICHSRDLSTTSTATDHTNTTSHSRPTEPLLSPTTPQAGHHHDVPSPRLRNSERSLGLPRWSQSHVMNRRHSAAIVNEKSSRNPLKRAKLLLWIKNGLVTLMALWAVFGTIRYLVAFCIYASITGQALSLALGAITGLSFALICCSTILGFVQPRLLVHGFPVQSLLAMRSVLQYSASCCLLGPSIVNLILVFVWKKTTDLELQTRHRCRLDIDLVWSPPFSLCNHKTRTWGLWLALSAVRLLVTLTIIITFHFIASSTQLKFVRRTKSRQSRHKKGENRLESYLTPFIPSRDNSKSYIVVPELGRDSILPYQSSDSALSTKASPRNRLRPNRSRLSGFSEDDIQAPNYNNLDFLPMNSDCAEPEDEVNSSAHHFLISQVTREMEEAIAFARSDDSGSSNSVPNLPNNESPELGNEAVHRSDHQEYYDNEDGFYTSSVTHTHRFCEPHQQYPADEEIRMLNGFIKRMPTIESMGSHELRSSMGAPSTNRDRERIGALSRPPTRNTLLSGTSEPHSGNNSLTAQAEVLAGMYQSTEIGELIRRGDTIRKVDNNSGSMGASTNSSSVLSYLTAPESLTKSLVIPDTSSIVPLPEHPTPKENIRRRDDTADMNS